MRLSPPDLMMIEAFIDGELPMREVPLIEDLISVHPELMEIYNALKAQRKAIKNAFLSNNRTN